MTPPEASAVVFRLGILLVEVSAEKGSTNATCYRAQSSSTQCTSENRAANTARDGANRTIAAATVTAIVAAAAAIGLIASIFVRIVPVTIRTLREHGRGQNDRAGNQRRQGAYG
jgi:hypothetical protein